MSQRNTYREIGTYTEILNKGRTARAQHPKNLNETKEKVFNLFPISSKNSFGEKNLLSSVKKSSLGDKIHVYWRTDMYVIRGCLNYRWPKFFLNLSYLQFGVEPHRGSWG